MMASSMTQLAQLPLPDGYECLLPDLEDCLRFTPVKHIHADGAVTVEYAPDGYYLENDIWSLHHFLQIEQFRSLAQEPWATAQSYSIRFLFVQDSLNLEAKFVFHQMVFLDRWALSATFTAVRSALSRLAKFVNEHHPEISSFEEMQSETFQQEYVRYLSGLGLATFYEEPGRKGFKKSSNLAIPSVIYNHLQELIREKHFSSLGTNLWKEDAWNISCFEKFGLKTPKSSCVKTISFTGIKSRHFRALLKRYLREKLMAGSLQWSTAHAKSVYLRAFLNFVHEQHDDWTDLCGLSRQDTLAYLKRLSMYASMELPSKRCDCNPRHYPKSMLSQIRTFLMDLQIMEYPEAPAVPALQLIRHDDTKGYTSSVSGAIKYLPDHVLDQFFSHISLFPEKYYPIVLTMYYTGLRVSDALELKWECLIRIDGTYWIETYVWKTQTIDHRSPITDEFAKILQSYIDESKAVSNADNNPHHFIFVNYRGIRKGQPYSAHALKDALNRFAVQADIRDENGNLFHFKNHAFRHTFSVKMINNGADIITVMQLLAHATPKMTLAYAKLLDSTKREAFERVIKAGVFSFSSGTGQEITYRGDAPQSLLDNLWQRHKLEAVDTPYGTCLQRKNGRCSFAKQPPCLTCNDGKPCRDLCIGALPSDAEKYDILIDSASRLVDMAQKNGRDDMAKENRSILSLLQGIREVLSDGGIIYGRMERLEGGDGNV